MLLTLRGTPFLYYGDELGLPEVPTDWRTALDPVARRKNDPAENRDRCRTPMPWSAEPGGGFTTPEATPWLPFGDLAACNVAEQAADPGSTLHLTRDLIALRRGEAALRTGAYAAIAAPAGAWAWRRGEAFAAAVNFSDAPVQIAGVDGTVAIATERGRDGEDVAGALALGPWEGAVVRTR
jgi:alpha-glucosidase